MEKENLIKKFQNEINLSNQSKENIEEILNDLFNIFKYYMGKKNCEIFLEQNLDIFKSHILEIIDGYFSFENERIIIKFKSLDKNVEYLFRIDNANLNYYGSALYVKNKYLSNMKQEKNISDFISKYSSVDDKGFICKSKLLSYKSLNISEEYFVVTTLMKQPLPNEIKAESEYGKSALKHNLEKADFSNKKMLLEHFNLSDDIEVYVIDRVTK